MHTILLYFFLRLTLPYVTWEAVDSNWGNRGLLPVVNKVNVLVKPAKKHEKWCYHHYWLHVDNFGSIYSWVNGWDKARELTERETFCPLTINDDVLVCTCVNESCLLMEGRGWLYDDFEQGHDFLTVGFWKGYEKFPRN